MDATGFAIWIAMGIILGIIAALILLAFRRGHLFHDLLYTVAAGLLGTFMGSEAFKEPWHWLNSEQGPERGGFFIVTALIFGAFITFFAMLAAAAEPPLIEAEAPIEEDRR